MRMYFFEVTVKVDEDGLPARKVVYRGARAWNELAARRTLLNQFIEQSFQVVRIDRVPEQCDTV